MYEVTFRLEFGDHEQGYWIADCEHRCDVIPQAGWYLGGFERIQIASVTWWADHSFHVECVAAEDVDLSEIQFLFERELDNMEWRLREQTIKDYELDDKQNSKSRVFRRENI